MPNCLKCFVDVTPANRPVTDSLGSNGAIFVFERTQLEPVSRVLNFGGKRSWQRLKGRKQTDTTHANKMSSKEQNEVAVEKIDNDKASGDAKCELKGTKRAAEVSDCFKILTLVIC